MKTVVNEGEEHDAIGFDGAKTDGFDLELCFPMA